MKYDTPEAIWEGITPCPHHGHMMQGCEHCANEVTARGARVEQMSADGAKIAADVVSLGGPQMPPSVILEARLDVLIDSILNDPKDRIRFEGEVGRRIMNVIKDVHAQVKQPALISTSGQRLRSVKDIPQA